MATTFGIDAVRQLLAENPKFHMSGEEWWDATPGTLTAIQRIVKPGDVTFEVGAGASSVVFAAAGARHTAVSPDPAEHELIRRYCKKIGVDDGRLKFIVGRSDDVLPTHFSPERTLDVAFVDGSHSFPLPVIDWHYAVRALKIGGKLLLDDIPIPAVAPIFRHMRLEPAWRLDGIFDHRTAGFTLLSEPPIAGALDWREQPFNVDYPDYDFEHIPTRIRLNADYRLRKTRRAMGRRFPALRQLYMNRLRSQ
jgi:precorrin-6B methylase 2